MSVGSDTHWRRLVREIPIDLIAVLVIVGVLVAWSTALTNQWRIVRFLFGGLLLFVLPGYVLVAIIFPGNGTDVHHQSATGAVTFARGITGRERLALSFGTSVALLPILALLVSLGPGFSRTAVFGSLSAFVVAGVVLAMIRRMQLPDRYRFSVPLKRWAGELSSFCFTGRTRDSLVNGLLVLSVLLAASAVVYAVAVPQPSAEYTSFSLLTEQQGELVSADYPTQLTRGQAAPLVVSVANHRHESATYTVVVEFQQVRTTPGERLRVLSKHELTRMQTTLQPGQEWRRPHRITPPTAGNNHRVVYYLYRGDAPASPTVQSANDHLQLWVNVSARS